MPPLQSPISKKVASLVATAFTDAQRTQAAYPRGNKLLLQAYNLSPGPFLSHFTHALNRILVVFTRSPAVERLVFFVAHFASSHTEHTGSFCSLVLAYLIEHSNAASRAVRFRTIQILGAVLNQLSDSTEISDELWDLLQDAVLARTMDKVPRVRAAASGALSRLQVNGIVEEDKFCARLIEMLSSDTSAAVRKASLQAVAVTNSTIEWVIRRTQDVSSDIRKTAYEMLAQKFDPQNLLPEERVGLLARGLRDRAKAVREACERRLLLESWFENVCEGNVFELVELLGCRDFENDAIRALKIVFDSDKSQKLFESIDTDIIDIDNMTYAEVMILRALSDSKKGLACLEKLLRSTSTYANVLSYYRVEDFATRHLLELSKSVDMSDEAGRKAVQEILQKEFLVRNDISEETVCSAVRALRRVVLDDVETSRLILEIIQQDILHSDISQDSNQNEAGKLETNEECLWQKRRALNICLEVLRFSRQGESSASPLNTVCLSIVNMAVLPQLISEHDDIRRCAIEGLGLFCLLDGSGDEARKYMPLFLRSAREDVEAIQEMSIQSFVDCLMVFDFTEKVRDGDDIKGGDASDSISECIESGSEEDDDGSSIVDEFVKILAEKVTHGDCAMRTIGIQGLAKLLFVRRITPRAKLLSRMLIAHHNPTTEDDDMLRQCLSVFFPAFAMSSPHNRLGLEDAFLPTCQTLMKAPLTSPLSVISVVQVAQFILHLTNPRIGIENNQHNPEIDGRSPDLCHERLVEVVLNNLILGFDDEGMDVSRTYGKILSNFRLTSTMENDSKLKYLRKLVSVAITENMDKKLGTVLQKFLSQLKKLRTIADSRTLQELPLSNQEENIPSEQTDSKQVLESRTSDSNAQALP